MMILSSVLPLVRDQASRINTWVDIVTGLEAKRKHHNLAHLPFIKKKTKTHPPSGEK